MSIYLDYNASTPLDSRILETMIETYRDFYGNTESRTHDYGLNASKKTEEARGKVASLLGVKKEEIIFTSGATESNNIAILGLKNYGEKIGKKHIITTAIEHKAVLEPCQRLEIAGFEVEYVNPAANGRIEVSEVLQRVRNDTLLVSVMHINNETGIIQPVDIIGKALWEKEVLFHVDAAQSCGKLVDEIKTMKYNMLSLTAHKMYGPQGVGALVTRIRDYQRLPLEPIMFGGGHERGLRSGTVPTALVCGLGKACEIAEKEYKETEKKYIDTREKILKLIKQKNINYLINGAEKYCAPNTLNISFPGLDSEALMIQTKQWCSISNGSACNTRSYDFSYVLKAMGVPEDIMQSAVRISWGKEKIDEEILLQFMSKIKEISVK